MESEGHKPDQTLEAVRERADKFQSIFENSTMGIFQSSLDGRFLMVNPAFAGILGYDSPEDLIHSIGDIESQFYHHAERRAEILAAIEAKEDKVKYFYVPVESAHCQGLPSTPHS